MRIGTGKNSASGRSTTSRARAIATLAVASAAVAVHASLWSIGDVPESRTLWGDERMYWKGAIRLHAGEDWHPEPLWPPFYPRFLATVLAISDSFTAVRAAQTLMLVIVAFLVRDLTRHLSRSRFAGDVACALALTYPPLAAFAHYLWPEVLHLSLFVGAFWILVRRPRGLWPLAAGALIGLALLTKSLLGAFLLVLPLPLALEGPIRRRAVRILLVTAAICAVVAPVAISNRQRATGVVIANSLAFNLWVGLNDRSKKNFVDPVVQEQWRAYRDSAPTYLERNAILWAKIRALVRERGVAILPRQLGRQYFRLFDKDSFLTDMLPGGDIAALGSGYRDTRSPIAFGLRATSYLMYAAILAGTAAGMVVCAPHRRRWLLITLVFIGYNLAIFLLLHVKSRYRVPILPFLFLYSGIAAAWAAHRLGLNPGEAELWRAPIDRRGWWAAAAATLLLLCLAFGRGFV